MNCKKILILAGAMCMASSVCAASLSLSLKDKLSSHRSGMRYLPGLSERLSLVVTLADPLDLSRLEALGFQTDTFIGKVATGSLPYASLSELAESDFVVSASEPRTSMPQLDITRRVTGVDRVQQPDQLESDIIAYTGRGVVIGVIDVGIDTTHPAFRDENGLPSKIVEFHTTIGAEENNSNHLISKVYTNPEAILNHPIEDASNGHGTHTASTAAGCFSGNEFRGIAPDAQLVLTQVGGTIYDDEVIYGINAAKEYAERNGLPLVESLSIGTISGAHDGTGEVCQAAAALGDAGHVICVAAGNDGDKNISYRHNFSTDGDETGSAFIYPDSGSPSWVINFEGWSTNERPAEIKFEMRDRSGRLCYETQWFDDDFAAEHDGIIQLVGQDMDSSVDPNLFRYCAGSLLLGMGLESNGRYLIEIAAEFRTSQQYYLCFRMRSKEGADMVMYTNPFNTVFGSLRQQDYFEGSAEQSINNFSTSSGAISIGSYNARDEWQNIYGSWNAISESTEGKINGISLTSGYGNLCDGSNLVLPHVAAPGTNIVAAYNSKVSSGQRNKRMATEIYDGTEYFWGMMSGTSMATPVVAGIVALWLEANATLTRDQILDVIEHSSLRDELLEDTPERVRYGKIDAFEGLRYISQKYGFVSAPAIEAEAAGLSVRYHSDRIECLIPESDVESQVALVDAAGRTFDSFTASGSSIELPRPTAAGVYILSVKTPARRYTQKLMIK